MMIVFFILAALAQEQNEFICNPPAVIKDRVNEYCIQATQFSIINKKPISRKITNGTLFFISDENKNGDVVLKMAHQCRGKKMTEWKIFANFCGYEIVEFDRQTPAIKDIRADIATQHRLNERSHRNQIDRLISQQMNPWIADPKKNIFENDGKVRITTLKGRLDITCHSPAELIYETSCK